VHTHLKANIFEDTNTKTVVIRAKLIFALSAFLALSACHKAKVASTPPPLPPPPATTASLTASPQAIESGQSSTLTWETMNATNLSIDAVGITTETVGTVEPKGSMQVSPSHSTTYTLYAKGPGGTETASARVTVTMPEPPPPPPAPSDDDLFAKNVNDVYFDFDTSDIRSDQEATIQRNAAFLTQHPNINFTVEGHCDERGSIEYNLALGDKRANVVKEALAGAAVSPNNVKTLSYGKEKPACTDHNESCWQQNRRGHFNRTSN
jgi:peptidoglycan-associated lipoprotein